MAKGEVSEKVWWLGFFASGLAGVIYVALTHSTPAQSVLHKNNAFHAVLNWLASPYVSVLTAFMGAVALSAALLFNFRKFSHWQVVLLSFCLGASLSMLAVSIWALGPGN